MQGMMLNEMLPDGTFWGISQANRALQHIQEITDRHGGFSRLVVLSTSPCMHHHQMVPSGEKGLQEKMPVLFSWIRVAEPRRFRHAIEPQPSSLAWKRPIIHAQETDDTKRNGPHRHHRATGDAPPQKP